MAFLIFQKFDNKEEILSFSEILKQNGIDCQIENTGNSLDSNFGNSTFSIEYILKLKKADFKRAEELATEMSQKELENIDEEYFMFDFSNDELKDVILKKDEWGNFNYTLAQKILKDRGAEVTEEQIYILKNERINELSKPEESQAFWVFSGYISAVLGGLLGIFIGWHLLTFKKTLPNGNKIYNYSAKDRAHGGRIFILGIVFMALWMILKFFL